MIRKLAATSALVLCCAAAFAAITNEQAMELGRKDTQLAYKGDATALWAQFSPEMAKAMQSQQSLATVLAQLRSQLGTETKVLKENVMPAPGFKLYTRLVQYSQVPGNAVVSFTFTPEGKIAGFFIRPEQNPAPTKYLDYKDKNRYTWPLRGGDFIVWQGGATVYENYHAAFPDERFAYDIMKIKDGEIFDGKQASNEDFYCFGTPVVAAAAGTVVDAVDQYADNPPNKPGTDPKQGNSIIIDDGSGEFAVYAHLKRGSVKVKKGDKVKSVDQLAQCGNSGNSPIPHLHFHLQTTPNWFKGDGLPVQFSDITVNGKEEKSASPVKGDIVTAKSIVSAK